MHSCRDKALGSWPLAPFCAINTKLVHSSLGMSQCFCTRFNRCCFVSDAGDFWRQLHISVTFLIPYLAKSQMHNFVAVKWNQKYIIVHNLSHMMPILMYIRIYTHHIWHHSWGTLVILLFVARCNTWLTKILYPFSQTITYYCIYVRAVNYSGIGHFSKRLQWSNYFSSQQKHG